ncbi:hypothetical protein D9M68_764620 [compost metagenome]
MAGRRAQRLHLAIIGTAAVAHAHPVADAEVGGVEHIEPRQVDGRAGVLQRRPQQHAGAECGIGLVEVEQVAPRTLGLLRQHARHPGTLAAVEEEALDRMRQIAVHARARPGELVRWQHAAEQPLELAEAGDQLRHVQRAALGHADQPGGAGADPLDRLVARLGFLDIDAGCEIFGHIGSPMRLRDGTGGRSSFASFESDRQDLLGQPVVGLDGQQQRLRRRGVGGTQPEQGQP